MAKTIPSVIPEAELLNALEQLPVWSPGDNSIEKEFEFQDFEQAFKFMTAIAEAAEERDHHPDWWNCYNRVLISLSTHDAGGVTSLDIELAGFIEQLL